MLSLLNKHGPPGVSGVAGLLTLYLRDITPHLWNDSPPAKETACANKASPPDGCQWENYFSPHNTCTGPDNVRPLPKFTGLQPGKGAACRFAKAPPGVESG